MKCEECQNEFEPWEGHDIQSIKDHGKCTGCMGNCLYCLENMLHADFAFDV